MQIIALGLWQAVCMAAIIAGCVFAYFLFAADDDDDGPPDAPGLVAEVFEGFPFGFHHPSETNA